MVAGAANPTRRVIEAGLMTIGLAHGIALPSSYFLIVVPEFLGTGQRIFRVRRLRGQCRSERRGACDIAHGVGRHRGKSSRRRRRASRMLSFSTKGSAQHPRSTSSAARSISCASARRGSRWTANSRRDAALVPDVAEKKVKEVKRRRRPRQRADLSRSRRRQYRL